VKDIVQTATALEDLKARID